MSTESRSAFIRRLQKQRAESGTQVNSQHSVGDPLGLPNGNRLLLLNLKRMLPLFLAWIESVGLEREPGLWSNNRLPRPIGSSNRGCWPAERDGGVRNAERFLPV